MPRQCNPFSARQLRPGVIPFIFAHGSDWSRLETRAVAANWRGQIVGPHGTGKSTLFAEWRKKLLDQGLHVVTLRLHSRHVVDVRDDGKGPIDRRIRRRHLFSHCIDLRYQCRLFGALMRIRTSKREPKTIVTIDGYEQLASWQRWAIEHWLIPPDVGLIVTTHRDLGLTTLLQTTSTAIMVGEITRQIIAANRSSSPKNVPTIPPELIQRLLTAHRGNVRETLFSLYDWYQSSVRLIATPAKSA